MTIQELCDRLSQFPPDTPVVVKGYEGGFNDVSKVEAMEMQLNINTIWFYGKSGFKLAWFYPIMQLNINTIWFYGAHGTNDHQHEPIEGIPMTQVVYLHGVNHIADEDWHNR